LQPGDPPHFASISKARSSSIRGVEADVTQRLVVDKAMCVSHPSKGMAAA
jgi:hypothetical protein